MCDILFLSSLKFCCLDVIFTDDFGMKKIIATFENQESAQRFVNTVCV